MAVSHKANETANASNVAIAIFGKRGNHQKGFYHMKSTANSDKQLVEQQRQWAITQSEYEERKRQQGVVYISTICLSCGAINVDEEHQCNGKQVA